MLLNPNNRRNNMVFDSLRVGGGRCPPIIVIILLVVSFAMVCNWWSMTAENGELLNQVSDFQDKLNSCLDEKDKCGSEKENVGNNLKKAESEIGALHIHLQKQNKIQQQHDEVSKTLTICKSELDSLKQLDLTKTATLETLRLEKDRTTSQLSLKQKEIAALNEELTKVKSELDQLKILKNNNKENDNEEKLNEKENEIETGEDNGKIEVKKEESQKAKEIKDNELPSVIDLLKSKKDDNMNDTIV